MLRDEKVAASQPARTYRTRTTWLTHRAALSGCPLSDVGLRSQSHSCALTEQREAPGGAL
jgi:hypothetical protein